MVSAPAEVNTVGAPAVFPAVFVDGLPANLLESKGRAFAKAL
jgi:hypothetical protein